MFQWNLIINKDYLKDCSLNSGTVGNGLIVIDVFLNLFFVEEMLQELFHLRNTGWSTNENDILNLGFVLCPSWCHRTRMAFSTGSMVERKRSAFNSSNRVLVMLLHCKKLENITKNGKICYLGFKSIPSNKESISMLSIGVGFQLLNMNNTINLNPSRQFIETFKTNGQNSHIFPFPSSRRLSRFPSSTFPRLSMQCWAQKKGNGKKMLLLPYSVTLNSQLCVNLVLI